MRRPIRFRAIPAGKLGGSLAQLPSLALVPTRAFMNILSCCNGQIFMLYSSSHEKMMSQGAQVTESERSIMLEVRITVPSASARAAILPETRAEVLEYVAQGLSALFGGATMTDGQGAWLDGQGALVREPVTVVSSYAEEAVARAKQSDILGIAQYVQRVLVQDSVLLAFVPGADVQFV